MKKKSKITVPEIALPIDVELYSVVRKILVAARAKVYVAANAVMVEAYWNVGREIVAKQGDEGRAKYGEGLEKALAVRLTAVFGAGFTASNLFNMRKFYLTFPKFYALRRELHAERK